MVGDIVRIQETRPISKHKCKNPFSNYEKIQNFSLDPPILVFKVTDLIQPVPKYLDPETGKLHTNPHVKNTFVNPEVFKKAVPKVKPEPRYFH